MSQPVAVLYFTDGFEAEASSRSAADIKDTLGVGAHSLALTRDNWVNRLGSLPPDTLCFLASHGDIGENGTIQSFLEAKGISHTHSGATTSSVLTDKHLTKLIYCSLAIPTPAWTCCGERFGASVPESRFLEKPRYGGSKRGIKKIKGNISISNASENRIIYEEIINGESEVSIVVLRDREDHTALSPVIRTRSTAVLGELHEAESDIIDPTILQYCQKQAIRLSRALDCYGVTKTDFVINERGDVFAIETDAIPGLSRSNAASLAAAQAGITYNQILEKIMETTIQWQN